MDVSQLLVRHAAPLVFGSVLAQQLVPIPVEPTLVAGETLAAKSIGSSVRMVATKMLTTLRADVAWFVAGRRYEQRPSRLFGGDGGGTEGGGRPTPARRGLRSLVGVRFIPGAVPLVPSVAAPEPVKPSSFLFYDLTGIVLWASLPVTGGMLFDRQAEILVPALSDGAVWFGLAAWAGATFLLMRRRSPRNRGSL